MAEQTGPVHLEVLKAAQELCRSRAGWRFTMNEIVRRLPHLKASTVRTHIGSRCCVNAPVNHLHRLPYFERVGRGEFLVRPAFRGKLPQERTKVAEAVATYDVRTSNPAIATIHAVVTRGMGGKGDKETWFTAECLEIAVVTQAQTLDELVGNLGEAVRLHINDDARVLGIVEAPRVSVIYEMGIPPA